MATSEEGAGEDPLGSSEAAKAAPVTLKGHFRSLFQSRPSPPPESQESEGGQGPARALAVAGQGPF